MKNIEQLALSVLKKLEVNTNVQLFAQQWIDENGIEDLEALFGLFDRLELPYALVPDEKAARSVEHKLVLSVIDDLHVRIGKIEGNRFSALDDTQPERAKFFILIEDAPREKASSDWVGDRLHAFRPLIPKLLLVSFITNLFALAIPFITMSIYDHVIGGDARHQLQGIAIGAALLFSMMGLLRTLRSRVFASVSNRLSREISQALVQKLLRNPYTVNQQMATAGQQNQILLADRLSGVLSGPLGGALFDIPFVLLFILAIGLLGGWLVLVPLGALLGYFLLAKRSINVSSKRNMQSTVAGTNRQNMLNEFTSKLAFMRSTKLLPTWLVRFEKASFLASKVSFSQAVIQSRYTSMFYVINVCATLSVMGLGIGLIFEQVLTPGGLIASMMLISKVTAPAQLLANSAMRLQSFNQSKLQVNRVLQQNSERGFSYQHHPLLSTAPGFKLEQVTLRYPKQSKPALSGVGFDIEPGEVVAITGPSGSGKSTLIEILAGLQPIQNGLVEMNGVHLNQYDPQLYRHWCFVRASYPDLLTLSVREWLDDGHGIDEGNMITAIERVGGGAWLSSLENGLDTEMSQVMPDSMFEALSGSTAHILIDAKAIVYPYPLYLLDNPVPDCFPLAKDVFAGFITRKRGNTTVVFSSHDPDLLKLADKVVVLNEGTVAYAGPIEAEQSNAEAANG
ncbi:ABC transporter transmembrane domain-containing protein [Vibrio tapetis]|uniref:ABC transporter: Transmembrane and ATP-binding protein n=1 Tax=Vibrio tapetis subsp. tapetis TaxID=1671868 RepID=A0A2N8ZM88_9VIBR|nr:ABC transporter transmembrane domain-containing protein [Vibrio tapetis]SON52976.1 ABC transporter: Transmembrane and ATP-binding protein [Vibrio tapetis subsp. tapetis]